MHKSISQEDQEKSRQTRHKIMMLNLASRADDPNVVDCMIQMLADVDMKSLENKTRPNFEAWLGNLSGESMNGLSNYCLDYIHHWGSGGGDYSTERSIGTAIEGLQSEVPRDLANAIFRSVVGSGKSRFEASCLTIDLMNDAMQVCRAAI